MNGLSRDRGGSPLRPVLAERAYCIEPWELDLAARVHQSLLPQPVRHPRIELDTRYLPASGLGGDYCQVLFPEADVCCLSICDVTGHGLGAALFAARVSSEVRRLTLQGCRPRDIVQQLNAFVLQFLADSELCVSFCAARLQLSQRTITYSGAGHPSPLVIRSREQRVDRLPSQNMLLGVSTDCLGPGPEDTLAWTPGDRLFFYTDGLTETVLKDGTLLGEEGLVRIAQDLCTGDVFAAVDCVLDRIAQMRQGPVQDDMTLMVGQLH